MKGTCEQIPFHFFLKFMMLRCGGGAVSFHLETANWRSDCMDSGNRIRHEA